MQCSEETVARLFYNVSSSFLLLFLFFYLTSLLLAKFFLLCGHPILQRNEDVYECGTYSEEEEGEEKRARCCYESVGGEEDHLVADIIDGGCSLSFLHSNSLRITCGSRILTPRAEDAREENSIEEETGSFVSDELSFHSLPETASEEVVGDVSFSTDAKVELSSSPATKQIKKSVFISTRHNRDNVFPREKNGRDDKKAETREGGDSVFSRPPDPETRRICREEETEKEVFGDTCTVGSTSKSSSEWRSSINCREPGNDDPFSSSSRRSCPKWESYTVFQKYDEEMLFLDRISAQKLHETESLRSIERCPSSISEKIIQRITMRTREVCSNPYRELESAYVAQICLTWEALNWNYKYFQQLREARGASDTGCPAYVAEQFQTFQILLQRYIENEPYQFGRRPVVYARVRGLAPKLLQVPEYRDSEDEKKDEYLGSRVSSDLFLRIMADSITTFMNFLKADRENRCHVFTSFFRRTRRPRVDPTLLHLLKKVNHKKKTKLKDIRRARKCLRRKRRAKQGDEMETLMALIDLKVVARVLRTAELTEEQMHWCEDKMAKVKVCDGNLTRDSSPLFFPAH